MATREENLKKINEELEKVAGGFYARYVRYNGGEFEKDQALNIENKNKIIHVTA